MQIGETLRVVCVLSFLWPAAALAQDASEPALKAAFLYNFARFAEWPAREMPAGSPLTLCSADVDVSEALDAMISGKVIGDHALAVRRVTFTGKEGPDDVRRLRLRSCHVLYLGRLDLRTSVAVLGRLSDDAVLTVSDIDEFTRMGGVARFFVERGRLRFEINTTSAQRAHLQLSAKLLQLARIVKD